MNGAESVLRSLAGSGIRVCFANPGTTELTLVRALDAVSEIRPVLCVFEGVATGAADGYARMAEHPAAALLHLGPGLANGLANLHNARRAQTPLVVLVGDHPGQHRVLDPPLESDIQALAGSASGWVRAAVRAEDVGADADAAVVAALGPPGRVATLVLPADVLWSEAPSPVPSPRPHTSLRATPVPEARVTEAATLLRRHQPAALLLGGSALKEPGLNAGARVASACRARFLSETFTARLERGGGLPRTEPVAYGLEMAQGQLEGLSLLVCAGARPPVAFFAQPGKPGSPLPPDCLVHSLAGPGEDAVDALERLADLVATSPGTSPSGVPAPGGSRPPRPAGPLTAVSAAEAVGALLPEGAIVVDEAVTNRVFMFSATAGAPRHDWLGLTGGAIGQGLPLAVGAAVAAPGRPVVTLEADGSALYTLQALWTMARESLDITVVVLSNRRYAILVAEISRLGGDALGPRGRSLLDLDRPAIDFASLARGLGVPAFTATTADDLCVQLERSLAEPGPHLIEAGVPPLFS